MSRYPVADTILTQLGGRRFIAMTGASSFTGSPDALSFRIPRVRGIFGVRVTLEASDTYRVEFLGMRLNPTRVHTVRDAAGIQCDQLAAIFEDATGLRTSLGRA